MDSQVVKLDIYYSIQRRDEINSYRFESCPDYKSFTSSKKRVDIVLGYVRRIGIAKLKD
jgi:hypothetical protein